MATADGNQGEGMVGGAGIDSIAFYSAIIECVYACVIHLFESTECPLIPFALLFFSHHLLKKREDQPFLKVLNG